MKVDFPALENRPSKKVSHSSSPFDYHQKRSFDSQLNKRRQGSMDDDAHYFCRRTKFFKKLRVSLFPLHRHSIGNILSTAVLEGYHLSINRQPILVFSNVFHFVDSRHRKPECQSPQFRRIKVVLLFKSC